jgi:PhnB protein
MQAQPYLFFDGRCEEALEFYKKALGIKVEMLMRFSESPDPMPPGMCGPNSGGKPEFKGFSLSGHRPAGDVDAF